MNLVSSILVIFIWIGTWETTSFLIDSFIKNIYIKRIVYFFLAIPRGPSVPPLPYLPISIVL